MIFVRFTLLLLSEVMGPYRAKIDLTQFFLFPSMLRRSRPLGCNTI